MVVAIVVSVDVVVVSPLALSFSEALTFSNELPVGSTNIASWREIERRRVRFGSSSQPGGSSMVGEGGYAVDGVIGVVGVAGGEPIDASDPAVAIDDENELHMTPSNSCSGCSCASLGGNNEGASLLVGDNIKTMPWCGEGGGSREFWFAYSRSGSSDTSSSLLVAVSSDS